jgi:signal transduction histidine kinase
LDTGLGIDEDIQEYLFIPFAELRAKDDLR